MAYTFKHGDRPLDDYTIQRAVGSGGFGEVYYAVSDGGREVALKYLKDNPAIELRGVSHCINLKSPHLVSIFDVKKNADGDYFVIMEYCSGPSLRDLLIAEPNGFEPQKAAFFVRELAKGLGYLHDRGIVHRDMKPGNIFYDDGYVKIGDYGLSKFISVSRHSAQTASIGTVHYMAPEIGSGNYSRGVDIYALGVMLYEMLLGKVPFEGSSMGEVLMKHLTAQPELDELPAPFGSVIRKALVKDPADRYQTVHEMLDDLLAVDDVKQSLAGFSPKSLEGAVRLGGADAAGGPIPSPNPARGFAADAQFRPPPPPPPRAPVGNQQIGELPHRLSKKMDRISRKLERKIAKLSGKPVPKRKKYAPPIDQAAGQPVGIPPLPPLRPLPPGSHRGRRIGLALMLSFGMVLGLGFLVGGSMNEDVGASAGMLAVFLTGGILASRKATRWFGLGVEPKWPRRLITAGCCAPLLAIGAAPMLDDCSFHTEGLSVWIGLLLLSVFARWDKDFEHGEAGEMSFWTAVWTGAGAFLFTAIAGSTMDLNDESFFLIAAGAAGVASLVLQALAWAGRGPAGAPSPASHEADTIAIDPGSEKAPLVSVGVYAGGVGELADMVSDATNAITDALGGEDSSSGDSRVTQPDLRRWGITRAFWGVISFAATSGVIVLGLFLAMVHDLRPDDRTGMIIGIVACGLFLMFALRRTTPLRAPGFWRESLRPFLLMALSIGVAAMGIVLARFAESWPTEERVGLTAGIAIAGLALFIVLFCRGRRTPKAPAPFLKDDSAVGAQTDRMDSEPWNAGG